MDRVSINHSMNRSSSPQVVRDYVNIRSYLISVAQVVSQRHLSINLDLSNHITFTPVIYVHPILCWKQFLRHHLVRDYAIERQL